MSNRGQTAGETATDNSKSLTVNDITFTEGDDRVTIEITGKAFANLCEITRIFNEWDENDYTPILILNDFCMPSSFMCLGKKRPDEGLAQNVTQVLPGAIAAYFDDGQDSLIDAFEKAGFSTSF